MTLRKSEPSMNGSRRRTLREDCRHGMKGKAGMTPLADELQGVCVKSAASHDGAGTPCRRRREGILALVQGAPYRRYLKARRVRT